MFSGWLEGGRTIPEPPRSIKQPGTKMIYGSISLSLMKSLELHIKLDHAIAVWHWLVSMFEPNKEAQ